MSGSVRNLSDRSYGTVTEGMFSGRKLFFLFQEAVPTKEQLATGDYTMGKYAKLYGLEYTGMTTNIKEASLLSENI